MDEIKRNIDKQFEFNQDKNLFYDGIVDSLRFTPETKEIIKRIDLVDNESVDIMVDYLTDRALQILCKVNQYYSFNKMARGELRNLYASLFTKLRDKSESVDSLAEKHYKDFIHWLRKSNSFAEKMYVTKEKIVRHVTCHEYAPELQIEILQIDLIHLPEPVLDVGCGKEGQLVNYLREMGIDAFGIDRFSFDKEYLHNTDWLEYRFEKGKWGTILSNLGFSNHFQHHHLRNDGNYVDYAGKYVEILNALKVGGSFHYAPGLPFIEQYLDHGKFDISIRDIGESAYKSVKITLKK